jgi:hypothetical protein
MQRTVLCYSPMKQNHHALCELPAKRKQTMKTVNFYILKTFFDENIIKIIIDKGKYVSLSFNK